MSYLDIAKKVKEDFRKGREAEFEPIQLDPTDGRIIAMEICSTVLQAHIWFALDPDFDPKDGQAIFYADELPLLKNKTSEQLRKIYETKLAFGPGTRVRQ